MKRDLSIIRSKKMVVTLLISFFLVALSLSETMHVSNLEEEQCRNNLKQTAEQVSSDLERFITSDRDVLDALAGIIAQQDEIESPAVQKIIDTFKPRTTIEHIALLLPGDKIMLPDAPERDVSGILSYETEKALGKHITDRSLDVRSNAPILRNYVPIKKNGTTVAMLYGVLRLDDLPVRFETQSYGDDTSIYIIDKNTGDFLLDTWHNMLLNTEDITGRTVKKGYDADQFEKDIESGTPGLVAFKSSRIDDYLDIYYMPSTINDWWVAISIPEKVAFATKHKVALSMWGVCTTEIILLILYFLYLGISSRRELNEKQKRIDFINDNYDIEKLLFSAHIQNENITAALQRIADIASAKSAFFAKFDSSDGDIESIYYNNYDAATDMAAHTYISGRKFVSNGTDQDLVATEKGSLLMPIPDINNNVIGVLGLIDANYDKANVQLLNNTRISFASLCSNMETYRAMKTMSEVDTLTGLLNRNCYEEKLDSYPERATDSLICVYADVNGLHEMNNTQGHAAGDRLLQTVAALMQTEFGHEDTYRIGGDEFVAFVIDGDISAVNDSMRKIEQLLCEKGYHASLGADIQNTPIDMASLIENAEKLMYSEKQYYYKCKCDGSDRR